MAEFLIKINSTGDTFEVAANDTILSILLKNGYAVENSCTSGLCGACRVPYLEGEPDHRDMILSDDEKTKFLTTCVSRCKSDEILLDLPAPDTDNPIIQKEKQICGRMRPARKIPKPPQVLKNRKKCRQKPHQNPQPTKKAHYQRTT